MVRCFELECCHLRAQGADRLPRRSRAGGRLAVSLEYARWRSSPHSGLGGFYANTVITEIRKHHKSLRAYAQCSRLTDERGRLLAHARASTATLWWKLFTIFLWSLKMVENSLFFHIRLLYGKRVKLLLSASTVVITSN